MNQRFDTLNDAIALAKFAHFKQKDKAGFDYFEHPLRVMRAVQAQGAAPYVQMAAVLHDVTEDTAFTPDMLRDLGFSEAVVEVVKLLDRNEAERAYKIRLHGEYDVYGATNKNDFYYLAIRRNPAALMIKLADIADNTLPYRLAYMSHETQDRLRAKYDKALRMLND